MRLKPPPSARTHSLAFCAGFVLGAAMMASPAMAVVLGVGAAVYLALNLPRG